MSKRRGTVADYAYWRGVRPSTVYNAIKAGRVPIGADKMIDFDAADKQWDNSHEHAGRGGDRRSARYRAEKEAESAPSEQPDSDVSLAEAKRRTEVLRAELMEIKKSELQGLLVRRDLVEKTQFALGKAFRDVIEARAVHMAPMVAGKTDLVEIETIIRREIRAALTEAADRAPEMAAAIDDSEFASPDEDDPAAD